LITHSLRELNSIKSLKFVDEKTSEQTVDNPILTKIEHLFIAWFTMEYVLRLFSSPDFYLFIKNYMNMIDLVAILPFYVTLLINIYHDQEAEMKLYIISKILMIFRVIKIVRILKLARHSTGMQSLAYTLRKSLDELSLLLLSIVIMVFIYGSMIYFIEKCVDPFINDLVGLVNPDKNKDQEGPYKNQHFHSLWESYWWATITMTTVGYGDVYPKTAIGQFIGACLAICGVIIIGLPIPIIVNNFREFYESKMAYKKTQNRRARIAGMQNRYSVPKDNIDVYGHQRLSASMCSYHKGSIITCMNEE